MYLECNVNVKMLEQERHGTAGPHYETCQTSSFDFPLKQKKTRKSPAGRSVHWCSVVPPAGVRSWLWTQRSGSLLWWLVSEILVYCICPDLSKSNQNPIMMQRSFSVNIISILTSFHSYMLSFHTSLNKLEHINNTYVNVH